MTTLKMLLAEIRYRKLNFVLSLLAVVVAVTLFVAGPVLVDGYAQQTDAQLAKLGDETRKLMRDMGFNLMIVPKDTNMSDFWADDFASKDMPEEYVYRLARDKRLTLVAHVVATLQRKIEWNRRKVLLVGYLPEVPQSQEPQTEFAKRHQPKKKPMGPVIEPGTVQLGHELGVDHKPGDKIEVLGQEFTVAEILPEQGSKEDITIAVHLSDAQKLLAQDDPSKVDKVNQIMALGCNCAGSDLPSIRKQVESILPETRVTEFHSIALARAEQRSQVAKSRSDVQDTLQMLAMVITPIIVLASAIWVGLLALVNVRERRTEIGLLRAIGKGSTTIASLFLGKAVVVGLVGALAGAGLGVWLGGWLGASVLGVPADYFRVHLGVIAAAVFGAPLLSAVASYLPTLAAVVQDPAVVLRDQ